MMSKSLLLITSFLAASICCSFFVFTQAQTFWTTCDEKFIPDNQDISSLSSDVAVCGISCEKPNCMENKVLPDMANLKVTNQACIDIVCGVPVTLDINRCNLTGGLANVAKIAVNSTEESCNSFSVNLDENEIAETIPEDIFTNGKIKALSLRNNSVNVHLSVDLINSIHSSFEKIDFSFNYGTIDGWTAEVRDAIEIKLLNDLENLTILQIPVTDDDGEIANNSDICIDIAGLKDKRKEKFPSLTETLILSFGAADCILNTTFPPFTEIPNPVDPPLGPSPGTSPEPSPGTSPEPSPDTSQMPVNPSSSSALRGSPIGVLKTVIPLMVTGSLQLLR